MDLLRTGVYREKDGEIFVLNERVLIGNLTRFCVVGRRSQGAKAKSRKTKKLKQLKFLKLNK